MHRIMKCIIITKWIEPYKLLETIKENYSYKDFTFDGTTKLLEKKKFFKELENSQDSLGLYMKNVNKYYFFSSGKNFDIWSTLTKTFDLSENDFQISEDIDKPFNLVDMGKAEAGLIIP